MTPPETISNPPLDLAQKNHNKHAVIELAVDGEAYGYCMVRLFPEDAPNTVENLLVPLTAKTHKNSSSGGGR